jgi:predicted TIM-barrel enzyme
MAVNYSPTLKTNRMTALNEIIQNRTAGAYTGTATAGKLVIGDGTLAGPGATGVLVTLTLKIPPGSVTADHWDIDCVSPALAANATATGTASKAEIRNNADAVIVSGLTVGTSGTNIILNSTSITNTQNVAVTSGIITHSA